MGIARTALWIFAFVIALLIIRQSLFGAARSPIPNRWEAAGYVRQIHPRIYWERDAYFLLTRTGQLGRFPLQPESAMWCWSKGAGLHMAGSSYRTRTYHRIPSEGVRRVKQDIVNRFEKRKYGERDGWTFPDGTSFVAEIQHRERGGWVTIDNHIMTKVDGKWQFSTQPARYIPLHRVETKTYRWPKHEPQVEFEIDYGVPMSAENMGLYRTVLTDQCHRCHDHAGESIGYQELRGSDGVFSYVPPRLESGTFKRGLDAERPERYVLTGEGINSEPCTIPEMCCRGESVR